MEGRLGAPVAQAEGRSDFYQEYRVTICNEVRSYEWERAEGSSAATTTGGEA